MPIVRLVQDNPFIDGRQSDRAMLVRQGLERHFQSLGHACLAELTLDNGRRADLVALSPKGDVTIVEIKSSLADLRADGKWEEYRTDCDYLLFATLPDVPAEAFPEDAGLIVCDRWGSECLREASIHRLPPARRKAVHLRFARASAFRLQRCCDHAGFANNHFSDVDAGG